MDQIFVTCGDIGKYEQTSVFAIVVPHLNLVQKWASENGIPARDAHELCRNPQIIAMVLFLFCFLFIFLFILFCVCFCSFDYYLKIVECLKKVGQTASLAPYEVRDKTYWREGRGGKGGKEGAREGRV